MIEQIDFLTSIDPDINVFNSLILDPETPSYYSYQQLNSLLDQTDFNLFLLNYNIRSFNANSSCFLAALSNFIMEPSFIILTETWITQESLELCKIPGYMAHHTFRSNMKGGGVSFFYRDHIIAEKNDELSWCNSAIESCVSKLNFGRETLCIVCVYRPPGGGIVEFMDFLNLIMQSSFVGKNPTIIAGDININIADLSSSNVTNYLNCLKSYNFLPVIDVPTRFGATSSSILDHIWTNRLSAYSSGVLCLDTTDHCPSFMLQSLNDTSPKNSKNKITFRPFDEFSLNKLYSKLENYDWTSLFASSCDVDFLCERFIRIIDEFCCSCFPQKNKVFIS